MIAREQRASAADMLFMPAPRVVAMEDLKNIPEGVHRRSA